jgi:serine/threonine-protein kinase
MAEVQLALQRGPAGFEKLVVVKLVHDALATQKAFVDMLLDEARVAALVKHPNVVDIYDLGQAEGRYFIAMEYLEGEPLLAVLRAGREGKRLDALSTGRLIADTAEGLDAAHELRSMSGERLELVHHDISLGNIVVLYNGQVKLVDFGVAKATQSAPSSAKVQGKFSYMAPEKLKGAQGDRRSDIFSLGCVMWEALTLKRLFRGGNDAETMRQVLEAQIQPPSKVSGDVPPEYDPIVMRALDRDPGRRQLTAKEMAVEIEELLRKRGYGAKNDRVAKYMQETFRSHIDARKKLVQEVVSKGHASAEILDAAFSMAELAQGTPGRPSADFSSQILKVSPIDPVVSEGSGKTEIGRPAWETSETVVSAPPVMADDGGETVIGGPLVGGWRGRVNELRARAERLLRPRLRRLRARVQAVLADPVKKRIAIAAGAGALLFIIILAIALRGGNKHAALATQTGSDEGSSSSMAAVVPPPAAPPVVIDAAVAPPPVTVDAAEPEIVIEHPKPPVVTHHASAPSSGGREAQALYKEGVQLFVKGDAKAALAALLKSRSANADYAPTWRVLGQVYRKLGDKGAAKNAFLRYLTLAPNASDAATVREQINQL